MNEWIVSDPEVLGGKPCIKGTRLSVEFVLELFASNASREQVLAAYPQIKPEALQAAIEYAAKSLKNEVIWDIEIPA